MRKRFTCLPKGLRQGRTAICHLIRDEDGVTVVEIILILVVLISLVVIFKKQLTGIVKDILSRAARDAKGV